LDAHWRKAPARPPSTTPSRLPPQPIIETPTPSPNVETVPAAQAELERAKALADAGRLLEAAALCERHLQEHGPSAQAYYLLGLVRDAGGDHTAIDCYRKALYLEPN